MKIDLFDIDSRDRTGANNSGNASEEEQFVAEWRREGESAKSLLSIGWSAESLNIGKTHVYV